MNVANEYVIELVKDYISAIDPRLWWQGYTLQELSYAKWFAEELLKRLEEQPETPPLLVIERFRDKMEEYSLLNERFCLMFEIAKGVNEDIVDWLI